MEITEVRATTHSVAADSPLTGVPEEKSISFVTVETDAGIAGYGETSDRNSGAVARFVNQEIAPRLEGRDPMDLEGIQSLPVADSSGQNGASRGAISAVDIALWDLRGKQLDEPVWQLLGGDSDAVDVYVTLGAPAGDRADLVETAERVVDRWTDRMKVVVARGEDATPASDAERVQAIRDAVGDGVEIAIDANHGYSMEEALDLCERLRGADVAWFEEPLPGNDSPRLADLREQTEIPIAAGQFEGHRSRHRELIESGAIDLCQPNACFVGGFTEARAVADVAASFDMALAHAGGWPFQNMHLVGGVPNGRLLEYHDVVWGIGRSIYEAIPEPENGSISLPGEPGLGLTPNWDALENSRVERS